MSGLSAWLRTAISDPRAAFLAALAVLSVVVFVLTYDQDESAPAQGAPQGFAVFPQGVDVGRLEPVRVAFEKPPAERDGAKIMSIEPATEGDFAWLNETTLLFQPDYPGFLRGFDYTVSVSAQPEAGLDDNYQAAFQVEGKLEVVATVPADGDMDVPEQAQILVQFNRSVAPLTLLDARDDAPVLQITPTLEGAGEWLNTSLYRFVPAALAPNTEYTVSIAAGLSSAADGVLESDYSWSFTSFGPAIVRVTPANNTEYAAPRQDVTVEFNQPMDRDSVESGFIFTDDEASVSGSFSWNDAGTVVTFTPSRNLAPLEAHTIKLSKGLAGLSGGATLNAWTSTFRPVGPLRIARTEPASGSTNGGTYGVTLVFSHPIDIESVDDQVSISGIPAEEIDPPYVYELGASFRAQLKPSTAYTVTVGPGIVDRYGQPLPPMSFSFTTAPLPASVNLAVSSFFGTYGASTEPILYFHSANTDVASFTLWPLTSGEAALFHDGKPPFTPTGAPWVPSQAPLRSWSEPILVQPDEVQVNATSLSGGGLLPKGDYFVRTSTPGQGYQSEFAFSVVDTAIVVKESYDGLLAWVLDYDTGEPLTGAQLNARGDALAQTTARTDSDGLAAFPIADEGQVNRFLDNSYVVTLDDGAHYGVTATGWQQGSYPYELGIPFEYSTLRYKGHIYTDRPIYRPGESVEVKAIVREDDDARYTVPSGSPPIDVVISDPQGNELLRQRATLSENGTFAVPLALGEEASTGDYYVRLDWSSSGVGGFTITSTSFRVAEFVRPEFEVSVTADAAVYANGDTVTATAEASFYFGGAVPGAAVEWAVLASPASIFNEDYRGYSFSDYDYWAIVESTGDPVRARGTGTTDAAGRFVFQFPAELLATDGPQEYTIAATVTDQSAQAVANSTTVTIHPADRFAGVRTDGWLAITGESATVEVVTLTKEGVIAPVTPVSIEVYKRRWVTTKVQTADGGRQYRSEPVDELFTTLAVTTGADGEGSATFTAPQPGSLRIVAVVEDAAGRRARSATHLWVGGEEAASWQVTNDDLIALVADRDEYAPGDTATILVPAPFEGAIGLVTVERGKIHSRDVRTFATTAETMEIPLDEHSIPNVYVSVVLYRPPSADDPIPRYKVGYVNLQVSTDSRQLDVTITPDVDQAQPGETVNYTVEVRDWQGNGVQSELSVSVVDKAVLALEAERSIDGLRAFWFERGLGVRTSSSLAVSVDRSNDALPAPAGGGKGGGGFDEDQLRQDFRNSAYWEAQIETDADGFARVTVPMPDNLTTWRFQARAISGDILVGEATNELLSTRPLLLRPALPRFLRVGDEVHLRLLVRNATAEATTVTVGIEAEGLVLADAADHVITVAPDTSEVVEWLASARADGTATITFRGTAANGTQDGARIELPVYLDVTPEAVATNGVVTTAAAFEGIYLPEWAITDNGSLDISVQPTLVGAVATELASFAPRPWDSVTDVATRVVAESAILRAVPADSTSAGAASLRSDVADLLNRQRPDGGWAWCSKGCRSDPLLTAWALLALGEAKRAGIVVDDASISRGASIVVAQLNPVSDVANPADPNRQAMFLYALSVAGRGEQHRPAMNALFEQYRAQLVPSGIAYLLMALHDAGAPSAEPYVRQLLNDLVTTVEPSANGNHWEDGERGRGGHAPAEATALVLTALARIDPGHPLVEETVRWLRVSRSANGWEDRVERARAVLALAEFAISTGELGADVSYEVSLDGREVLEGEFDRANPDAVDAVSIPLSEIEKGDVWLVEFARKVAAAGRLYYKLDLHYVTPAVDVEARNRGFAVAHEYTALDDPSQPVSTVEVGDVIRVKVTVVTTAQRNYVVVRDHLPAGLEPIDPGLDTTDPALISQLEAERQKLTDDGGYVPRYWAPWYRWYYNPWKQVDIRDDRIELWTDTLDAGVYEYIYYARATAPGTFFVAPAHAEEGLFPEVFGRSDSGVLVVE